MPLDKTLKHKVIKVLINMPGGRLECLVQDVIIIDSQQAVESSNEHCYQLMPADNLGRPVQKSHLTDGTLLECNHCLFQSQRAVFYQGLG